MAIASFKKEGRIMFLTPNKIADFTDEVAKSRIKIFQLWRKLFAFTFRFIKTNTLYNNVVILNVLVSVIRTSDDESMIWKISGYD